MLNEHDGQLAFYTPGWLRCTSLEKTALPEKAHSPSPADQHIKKAGEQAVAMGGDKHEAWVQTSPTKHPRHDTHSEHALLGLKAMDELGLHLDMEQRAIHTHKMRTVRSISE